MTKEDILHHFQDINFYYNDCGMYDDLSRMLDELISENKGDLISRQAVINAIANTCFWLSADNWEELTKCINSIPSADIIDHARAIKEYCKKQGQSCGFCPFNAMGGNMCRLSGMELPLGWDLPEGEKE